MLPAHHHCNPAVIEAPAALRECRRPPRVALEVSETATLVSFVAAGLGVSLVPDWSRPWPEGLQLARIPPPEESVPRRIGVIWSRASVRLRLVTVLLQESAAESAGLDEPGREAAWTEIAEALAQFDLAKLGAATRTEAAAIARRQRA